MAVLSSSHQNRSSEQAWLARAHAAARSLHHACLLLRHPARRLPSLAIELHLPSTACASCSRHPARRLPRWRRSCVAPRQRGQPTSTDIGIASADRVCSQPRPLVVAVSHQWPSDPSQTTTIAGLDSWAFRRQPSPSLEIPMVTWMHILTFNDRFHDPVTFVFQGISLLNHWAAYFLHTSVGTCLKLNVLTTEGRWLQTLEIHNLATDGSQSQTTLEKTRKKNRVPMLHL
ncbi:uncharacterized protein LOC104582539 [Brachypodium distachyon]|uniref:uncharacterized protein LOC104582539 n=1 Tax=Brachypodium distachyon TaxID=15368 RepID=UPI00071DD771|nr:uncharacterized protein LOC104582539 [Brachypodium distachyon]|eukprot:XP_014753997.1 uncharacterized protein LOC104582539 [Brachypodium distachyon]